MISFQVINLLDLLWYLCYHWRSLIVGMLLCALLASGFRIYKNDAYNAGVEAQLAVQESPEEEISTYDTLTQADLLKQSYVGYINSGAAAGAVKAIDADMDQSAIDELISAVDLTSITDRSSFQTGSFEADANTLTDTETVEIVVPEKVPLTSGLVKYLILGLILGIFLWAVVWVMIYILVPTLKTTDDITRCFQYYLMADLSCCQNGNKRFGTGIDKFLGKLRYRDALSLEEEQRLLATNLKVTCRKEEVSSVYLTSSYVMSDAEQQRIDALIQSLAKENITAVYGRSIERDAESYEKMTEKQGVKILGVVVM